MPRIHMLGALQAEESNLKDQDPDIWISEILNLWNKAGIIGKLSLIFACIGASTTLTNLAGLILEWRGLIAEMLSFYTQYVRNPIGAIIRFVTFDYLRPFGPFIDAVLLYLIYFAGEKRVIGKLSERSALNASMFIGGVIILPIVTIIILLLALYFVDIYLVSGIWNYAGIISTLIPLIMIFLSITNLTRSLIWLAKGNCPEWLEPESQPRLFQREIREFILFTTPLVVAFVVLAVLASINLSLA
jgi:hypothetical protein